MLNWTDSILPILSLWLVETLWMKQMDLVKLLNGITVHSSYKKIKAI